MRNSEYFDEEVVESYGIPSEWIAAAKVCYLSLWGMLLIPYNREHTNGTWAMRARHARIMCTQASKSLHATL